MKKSLPLFSLLWMAVLSSLLIFPVIAWADDLQTNLKQGAFTPHSPIQDTLIQLAENNGDEKPKACHQETSVENCAGCCRDVQSACVALVVPLCHQGDPSRAEFRHCMKDKESRCKGDFNNCAWLCKRAK